MAYIRRLPSGIWQATVRYPDDRRRTYTHSLKGTVELWADAQEQSRARAKLRAEFMASDGDGLDPCGHYVYMLWRYQGAAKPLYVGSSANILRRLGEHLGDSAKRPEVGWVTFIWCASETAMLNREGVLIRELRPPWSRHIPAETLDNTPQTPPGLISASTA
jgi:hypothetical protein